jgi:hypothetical protein
MLPSTQTFLVYCLIFHTTCFDLSGSSSGVPHISHSTVLRARFTSSCFKSPLVCIHVQEPCGPQFQYSWPTHEQLWAYVCKCLFSFPINFWTERCHGDECGDNVTMVPVVSTKDFCVTGVREVRSRKQSSQKEKTKESWLGFASCVGRHGTGNVCQNGFLPLEVRLLLR